MRTTGWRARCRNSAAPGQQGFIEAQNLIDDPDGYSLRVDQLAEHAAKLVGTKVDVIIAAGDP